MEGVIDRFEGDFAVVELADGMRQVERALLPEQAREGDVLRFEEGCWQVDRPRTEERRALLRHKLEMLWEKD